MRRIINVLLAVLSVLICFAQTEIEDSLQIEELQEVVIEAPRVIRKSDMDVYHPSKSAVEHSANGMQLLNNLMIPTLTVNDALGSVQAAGQSVQIRINGREATIEQVRAILPETIKRVEWIDNPGLRYGGANYVLNIIVVNPTLGGSFQTFGRQALNTAWGDYMADIKLNNGKSQWDIGAQFKLTDNIEGSRQYKETFTYVDGNSLTRTESPKGGTLDNTYGNSWITYSYIKPDTTIFIAELSAKRRFADLYEYHGQMSLSDGSDDILLTDASGGNGTTPSLSLYWQQNFRNDQMLIFNVTGSIYYGRTWSHYVERQSPLNTAINDISTDISDRNQAYAVEADYVKNWSNSRLTVGATYSANRNRACYDNLDGQIFHQRQDKVYVYGEYYHRLDNWTATVGLGAQYTDFLFRETNEGNHSWSARPQATITYSPNSNHNFRLNFTSWQSAPSLAETNIVPQQLDGFQWRVGNQDLKTSTSYMLTFRYGFNLPRLSGSFGVRAFTSPNAITPYLYWENDRLITSYENSKGLQNLSFFFAPQIEIIPDWFMASGYVQFRRERMRGTDYKFYNSNWSGYVSLQLMHWGFNLSGAYTRAQRDLWGEKLSWGEDVSIIDLSYNWKSWQFGAGVVMPFGRYDQGQKSLSKWNKNEQHMRINMRWPYISISYNLQWGRQKRGAQKLFDVEAEADRSKAGGR